ncbi:MAG: calcium/sodium antiporter [Pseudomonadota bacterium]
MMDFLLVIGGLLLLVLAGDSLVRGAVALSLRLGVPALIVSATVVAFGTSAPELLISVQAALEGAPGIALGNVVGSNIANVWLVLGVPALIAPMAGCGEDAKRSLYFMLAATAVFVALLMPGVLWWWGGLILLAITALMVADSIRHALAHRAAEAALASGALASGSVGAAAATAGGAGGHDQDLAELEDIDPNMPTWKVSAFIVGGMVGLPLGAQLLIDGARGIALDFGVSEAAIGVTLVAIGTSLPELATTVMAAMRRQADVAIGNVVGSNLFNITAIIGTAALFAPMDVPAEIMQRDVWVMVAATLMLAPFALFCRTICRVAGSAFLLLYIGYVVVALS